MECVELAPAVGCVARFESGSKLHALHTLRAIWFRLCRPGDRRALPPAVSERLTADLTPAGPKISLCPAIGGRSSAWLEPQIVDLDVAGSNPVDHPIPRKAFLLVTTNHHAVTIPP